VRFGNLIGAHEEKMRQVIRSHTEAMIRQRRYVTCLGGELEAQRLDRAGTELFAGIYKNPIPFPFDGFSTAKGDAADTCQELTAGLLLGKLDYDALIAKPAKAKNRGITVLKDTWGVFSKNGNVLRRPSCPVVRTITEKWDEALAAGEKRLPLALALQQLCKPPYGANVASAGMVLGVFVAPRSDGLIVVRDGQQIALSQWLQDGALKGRFIDVRAQANIDLVLLGEESSEWETLLDEWEQAESHSARSKCLRRSNELKVRIPVPPTLNYRVIHLHEQGVAAIGAIAKMDKDQNDAICKLEWGCERKDIGALCWGAAVLCNMRNRMIAAKPLWTDHEIASLEPHIERARQAIIQDFPEWLARQAPSGDSPGHVGDFKHKMLHLVGGNLKTLGLESEHVELETRTGLAVANAESAAEARQLVRDVRSWLQAHADSRRIARVAEIRGLLEVGKEYSAKLQGMAERIQLLEVGEVRSSLAQFLVDLRGSETAIVGRGMKIWRAKVRSEEDLVELLDEVEAVTAAFENCPNDLKDLHLMRRALRMYQQDYHQLSDERLTWGEFDLLAARLKEEARTIFQDGDLPWPTDETIDSFVETVSKQRKERSDAWIEQLGTEVEAIGTMSTADANRLHERASSPPALLSDPHAKRLARFMKQVEARLDTLAVEWLVEKFRELSEPSRKSFLQIISQMSGGT
jgi:hypothetical protein